MLVKLAVRHGHLNEATQQVLRDKAEKLLHFFDRLTMIEVTVDMQRDARQVEIVAQAEHKHGFVATESHPDPVAAMDLALNKLEKQLTRYKEKIQDHRRTPSAGDVTGTPSFERPAGQ